MIKAVIFNEKIFQEENICPDTDSMLEALNEKGLKTKITSNIDIALKELDVLPEECLYIGDGTSDLKNAGEAGMHPVQATWHLKEGGSQEPLPGFRHAENPMDVLVCAEEGDYIFYASWYPEVEKGDFISKNPTYECGHYFHLFHEGRFEYDGVTLKYYWYDPREHGFKDNGKLPLLNFLHGTSNSLVGDLCINYTGAEFYASESYQKTMGGAYILIPVANEYEDENGYIRGYWSKEYLESVHALIMNFIAEKTDGVGLRFIFGNSSGATFVLRLMDTYMDDFDVVVPVGSAALPDDSILDQYDEKGKTLFFAMGRRDEFHSFDEEVKPRLPRLERMKNCVIYIPEWVRNGDGGIASIIGGVEMGQHCLMNPIQCNLILDDGTPMDERFPEGITGWIAGLI